jgi:hypothetical protein
MLQEVTILSVKPAKGAQEHTMLKPVPDSVIAVHTEHTRRLVVTADMNRRTAGFLWQCAVGKLIVCSTKEVLFIARLPVS